VGLSSSDGPFTKIGGRITFLSEQFWGRAARASNDSKESGARFYFPWNLIPSTAAFAIPSMLVQMTESALTIRLVRTDSDQ